MTRRQQLSWLRVAATAVAAAGLAQLSTSTAVANPCDRLAPIAAARAEIAAAFAPAEMAADRAEACRLANAYLRQLGRQDAALRAMPQSCAPQPIGLHRQYVARERIAWLGKATRACGPDRAPGGRQHRIIKVE